MTETRISTALTFALLLLAIGVILALQPYSVRSAWSVYDAPGRRFLGAALRWDSSELASMSASAAAMDWAARTRREHARELSVWARFARAGTGVERSDTSRVLFETGTDVCPLLLTFVGPKSEPRVLEAKLRCYTAPRIDPRSW